MQLTCSLLSILALFLLFPPVCASGVVLDNVLSLLEACFSPFAAPGLGAYNPRTQTVRDSSSTNSRQAAALPADGGNSTSPDLAVAAITSAVEPILQRLEALESCVAASAPARNPAASTVLFRPTLLK